MSVDYQIAAKSVKGDEKEHYEANGDHCAWMEENNCVVLVLADGVGSSANDARASETTCKVLIGKCREALSNGQTLDKSHLIEYCKNIDLDLFERRDMACFSAILWYVDTNTVTWIHAGDTRIYRYNLTDGLCQITQDDHAAPKIIKFGGKIHTDHGAITTRTPLSVALGDRSCKFQTGTISFLPGECLVFCSDGMYDSELFSNKIIGLLSKANLHDAICNFSVKSKDDASLLVIRREDGYEQQWTPQELCDAISASPRLFPDHILLREINTMLNNGVENSRLEETLISLVKKCREQRLFLSFGSAENIVKKAKEKYYKTPAETSEKKLLEQLVIALQNYVFDIRRFC